MLAEQSQRMVLRRGKNFSTARFIDKLKARLFWDGVFHEIFVGFVISIIAFLLSSLVFVQNRFEQAFQKNINDFNWIVLVRGDQLAIDEVGRFLKQFDDVHQIEFISSEQLIDRIYTEGVSRDDLNLINRSQLPSSWRVSWLPNANFTKLINENLPDMKNFPAVVDVVYDSNVLARMNENRWHSAQLKLCLSAFLFLCLLFTFLLLGKILFFGSLSTKQLKAAWPLALSGVAFWWLGVGFFAAVIGPVDWGILGAGAIVFFYRSLFSISKAHE